MRGIRHDWAGRPCITWSVATELLESLRAAAARKRELIEERLVATDAARRAAIPQGIPLSEEVPGLSPAMLMMAADPFPARRRQSVLEHALEHPGGATVYTPVGGEQ
jgi:hypothetical protein